MKQATYGLLKKIHLYACLSTVAVLLMFILSSYIAIHHDFFHREPTKAIEEVTFGQSNIDERTWISLEKKHKISGRLSREVTKDGTITRHYNAAGSSTKLIYTPDPGTIKIERTKKNSAGAFFGIHRQRGYGGGLKYDIHAFFLDVTGFALILFSVTGVIMWLHLLKNNKIAWFVFLVGLIYYGCVIWYLIR